jgi:hypothetical protein
MVLGGFKIIDLLINGVADHREQKNMPGGGNLV